MYSKKATVSFLFDQRRKKNTGMYPIKLIVFHEGKKERYATGIDLTSTDWEKLQKTNLRDDDLKLIKRKLQAKKDKAEGVIDGLEEFSFSDFEAHYLQEKKVRTSVLLKDLFLEKIQFLEASGRVGSASSYNTTMNSLLAFQPNALIKDVNRKFLQSFETYMLNKHHAPSWTKLTEKAKKRHVGRPAKKMSPTTVGIYLRQLRAIINMAIEQKLLSADKYPFKGYDIPCSRNIKKSLTAAQIKQLLQYDTEIEVKRRALDFWLFSYISNGINFTDICNLVPESIKGNFFSFFRAKTMNTRKRDKRPIRVPLTHETSQIIQRWKNMNPANPYLFPVLQSGMTPRQQKFKIQGFIAEVNKAMRSIADELGINVPVGTYVARHSHSTILKRSGASTEMIKENLGHASVMTTESYLDDFEDEVKIEYARKLTEL